MASRTGNWRVPRRPEEEISRDAERYRGDREKVRTSAITALEWEGVALISRYGKADEYELMIDMVEAIKARACSVAHIFCDSKAGSTFDVMVKSPSTLAEIEGIGDRISQALLSKNGGYNYLTLNNAEGTSVDLGCAWIGEE